MAVDAIRRLDLEISLRTADEGRTAVLRAGCRGTFRDQVLSADVIAHLRQHAHQYLAPDFPSYGIDLNDDFKNWRREVSSAQSEPESAALLPRITVAVDDPRLALVFWEVSLAGLLKEDESDVPVVRTTPVLPRLELSAFTFPLRIVQIGPQRLTNLDEIVDKIVSTIQLPVGDRIAETGVCDHYRDLKQWRIRKGSQAWPTAEILHFDFFGPSSREWTIDEVLSTARPDEPGTLGWLTRLTDDWQTRLVVLDVGAAWSVHARGLAAALVRRGGPAVLLRHVAEDDVRPHDPFYTAFYDALLRDRPLDAAIRLAVAATGKNAAHDLLLFAGAGREDALRFLQIGTALDEFAGRWLDARQDSGVRKLHDLFKRANVDLKRVQRQVDDTFGEFRKKWSADRGADRGIDQSFLPPLFETLDSIKSAGRIKGPRLRGIGVGKAKGKAKKTAKPRFVIAELGTANRNGSQFQRVDPRKEFVQLGDPYQLGIHIGMDGPQSIGAVGLFEEVIRWSDDTPGTWLEVGLTSLDFDVIGDPVQELWLPRKKEEPSDRLCFVVVPRRAGICMLRFCVYYRQNVLQSHRMVVWVQDGADRGTDKPDREAMADALQIKQSKVGDASYRSRCEYSLTKDLREIPDLPGRALSIVTNDLAAQSVVTLKGPDVFQVRINKNLPNYVRLVRDKLFSISVKDVNETPVIPNFASPSTEPYSRNRAELEKLKEELPKLAAVGWDLYDQIIPNDLDNSRSKLDAILKSADSTIHVANVCPEAVIPWGLVYDRHYDPDVAAETAAYDVCLAAMPDANGELPVHECEASSDCLLQQLESLNREREEAGKPPLKPETIACPLRFWGFRHIIESPAQQVVAGRIAAVPQQQDRIAGQRPTLISAGINQGLNLADHHARTLEELIRQVPETDAQLLPIGFSRDEIIENLRRVDLSIVYLYCHTRGGQADPSVFPPHLEFTSKGIVGKADAGDFHFARRWENHPLVFLNGCGTAAFSPDALSEFIVKFVHDRGAGGVVGTEIPVVEELAGEFGLRFLAHFLRGSSAGLALMRTRRELLAQNNPLGLAYTLYAPADLSLANGPRAERTADAVLTSSLNEITVGDDYVEIGGIRLPRRPSPKP